MDSVSAFFCQVKCLEWGVGPACFLNCVPWMDLAQKCHVGDYSLLYAWGMVWFWGKYQGFWESCSENSAFSAQWYIFNHDTKDLFTILMLRLCVSPPTCTLFWVVLQNTTTSQSVAGPHLGKVSKCGTFVTHSFVDFSVYGAGPAAQSSRKPVFDPCSWQRMRLELILYKSLSSTFQWTKITLLTSAYQNRGQHWWF